MTPETLLEDIYLYDDRDNFGDMSDRAHEGTQAFPEIAAFWGLRARAQYLMGFTDEEGIVNALKREPYSPYAVQVQAYGQLDDGHPEAALAQVEEALKHHPEAYALLMARAWIHSQSDNIEAALSDWQTAIALAPQLCRAQVNLASHLAKLNRIDEAAAFWKRAFATQPDNGMIAYNAGTFLQNEKRYAEAQPFFDRGRELLGEQNAIQHNRAINLQHLLRHQEAIDEWKQLLTHEPDWEWPLEGVMDSLIALGRFDEAKAYARQLDRVLDDYEGQLMMAEECYRASAYDVSLAVLQALPVGSYAQDPRVWYWFGWLYLDAEKLKDAVFYFEKAVSLDEEREHAYFGLAKALFKLERHEEALKAINTAIALDANDERYHDLRVQIVLNLGHYADMLESCDHLIAARGDEEFAHAMRALALKQLGRYKEAAAQYRIVAGICDNEGDAEGSAKALSRAAECDVRVKSRGFIAKIRALLGIT